MVDITFQMTEINSDNVVLPNQFVDVTPNNLIYSSLLSKMSHILSPEQFDPFLEFYHLKMYIGNIFS